MSDPIAVAGQRVFETFGACAAAPDDEAAARAADEALSELDALLRAAERRSDRGVTLPVGQQGAVAGDP